MKVTDLTDKIKIDKIEMYQGHVQITGIWIGPRCKRSSKGKSRDFLWALEDKDILWWPA